MGTASPAPTILTACTCGGGAPRPALDGVFNELSPKASQLATHKILPLQDLRPKHHLIAVS